jgi:NAD-dependent deacetylase
MGRLIIFTGAGISAESGIATFRGNGGLWNNHNVEDVCDQLTWKQNFDLVHEFYNQRRVDLGKVIPNATHQAISDWQKRYETIVLTQNIDDLLERAGCRNVVHLHGFLTEMHCTACGHVWDIGYTEWKTTDSCTNVEDNCKCKKGIKPHVVFFNAPAPMYHVFNKTMKGLTSEDVILVMGTSGMVIPIDSYLFDRPGFKILNNLEPTRRAFDNEIIPGTTGTDCYDKEIFEPSTVAVKEINDLIIEKLGQGF